MGLMTERGEGQLARAKAALNRAQPDWRDPKSPNYARPPKAVKPPDTPTAATPAEAPTAAVKPVAAELEAPGIKPDVPELPPTVQNPAAPKFAGEPLPGSRGSAGERGGGGTAAGNLLLILLQPAIENYVDFLKGGTRIDPEARLRHADVLHVTRQDFEAARRQETEREFSLTIRYTAQQRGISEAVKSLFEVREPAQPILRSVQLQQTAFHWKGYCGRVRGHQVHPGGITFAAGFENDPKELAREADEWTQSQCSAIQAGSAARRQVLGRSMPTEVYPNGSCGYGRSQILWYV